MSHDLELVPMALGDMVGEPGKAPRHAYFPTTAVVSLHYATNTGVLAESASVGREGVVGIALFLGGDSMPSSAVVRSGGHGYRLARAPLLQGFARVGPLRSVLLRYTQALFAQIGQTAACYRHHTVEQQLIRWLLSTADRMPPGDLVMTQELVANLLGVRRESITEAAAKLRDGGYIRYRRGQISILDPAGLEKRACECYAVVKAEFQRLQPRAPAPAGSANI
jgi:CRP-like cAMP-binding protein